MGRGYPRTRQGLERRTWLNDGRGQTRQIWKCSGGGELLLIGSVAQIVTKVVLHEPLATLSVARKVLRERRKRRIAGNAVATRRWPVGLWDMSSVAIVAITAAAVVTAAVIAVAATIVIVAATAVVI